ncbi:MAG: GNAT family N-acetyltransferase [Candidatus Lambdaproteobacteria bacterium]|nr:GNAT family N-acetyltransferase [Candidatus Lambdaproteobacteria bacterium]
MTDQMAEFDLEPSGDRDSPYLVRVMTEEDLPAVVNIDRRGSGFSREQYLQEKMASCTREPVINTSLLAVADGNPVGFLMGQLFFGEFGIPITRAVLDTLGVHPDFMHRGVGHALIEQFRKNMTSLRVEAIDTLLEWDRFDLLEFFRREGFHPANMVDLVWKIDKYPFAGPSTHVAIRNATADDLRLVSEIDQEAMLVPRPQYFDARFQATLRAPRKNVFLVAERQGELLGFMTGTLFAGEFGIQQTRGVIDSFSVRESARHQSVGSAMIEDLLSRSHKAGIRQMETIVRWNNWELLQFFEYVGFRPSSRVNLELRL